MSCNDVVCGTGGWTGPLPGDPDNNLVLSATPAFGGIDVTWTYPLTNPEAVAHTLLYRATSSNFLHALQINVVAGNFFYDKTTAAVATRYYYWIKVVSVNGTVGELIGPASAVARLTIEQTIEDLTGKIDAGALAQTLKSEINTISLLGKSITQEVTDRVAANAALAGVVSSTTDQVDVINTFVINETNNLKTANSALVSSLNLYAASFNGAIAGVSDEIIAAAGPGSALAKKIDTVEVTLNGSTATGQVGLSAMLGTAQEAIGAMYTAKVSVDGLIGGFGIYNDGAEVEAGFDVDTFWIGRTGTNKRKPFIIQGDEVFINQAVINELTFDKLKAADGSIIVSNGKITANYLDATNLSVVNGTFSGKLVGATGTFSGKLVAGTVDFASSVGSSITYSTPGTRTLTIPAGMTNLRATLVGGGGGGGGGDNRGAGAGIGGSKGVFASAAFAVTAGSTYTLVVGTGGGGGSPGDGGYGPGTNGGAGTPTYVTGLLSAAGGAGGTQRAYAGPEGASGENSSYGTGGIGGAGNRYAGVGGISSGGGGGASYAMNNGTPWTVGAAGGGGYAIIEFYDPNGVVLKAPFEQLKSELRAQGHTLS